MRLRSLASIVVSLAVLAGGVAAPTTANGKPKPSRSSESRTTRASKASGKRVSPPEMRTRPPRETPVTTGAAKPLPPSDKTTGRAGADEPTSDVPPSPTTTSDTPGGKTSKTRVYTFGAMDVEGKLKTPQLLYFLNRVKLELEMSAPDRRSFMKELEKSADDPSL